MPLTATLVPAGPVEGTIAIGTRQKFGVGEGPGVTQIVPQPPGHSEGQKKTSPVAQGGGVQTTNGVCVEVGVPVLPSPPVGVGGRGGVGVGVARRRHWHVVQGPLLSHTFS